MKGECIFSPCGKYRYTLHRQWEATPMPMCKDCELHQGWCPSLGIMCESSVHRALCVIGLNPSTADETKDDPTIRRDIGYAKRWGFGSLVKTNIFAWRDTDPAKMKAQAEPIGADNNRHIVEQARRAGLVLCAWGRHGLHLGRGQAVLELLKAEGIKAHALYINMDGTPKHTLYCRGDLRPFQIN